MRASCVPASQSRDTYNADETTLCVIRRLGRGDGHKAHRKHTQNTEDPISTRHTTGEDGCLRQPVVANCTQDTHVVHVCTYTAQTRSGAQHRHAAEHSTDTQRSTAQTRSGAQHSMVLSLSPSSLLSHLSQQCIHWKCWQHTQTLYVHRMSNARISEAEWAKPFT